MKIGIDARFWGQAGPGRYVKNLVLALEKLDSKNEYVVFLDLKGLEDYKPSKVNFRKVGVGVSWYSFAEQLKLPFIFARERLDLLHVPHFNIPIFYPGKIAITIHDLTIHRFSTVRATTRWRPFNLVKRLVYRFVFWLAVKRAEVIFVPTEFVKKDLLGRYPWLGEEKIIVTYEGVGEDVMRNALCGMRGSGHSELGSESDGDRGKEILNQVQDDEKRRVWDSIEDTKYQILNTKYDIHQPFLLYVGSMYPHKNLLRLIEAFRLIAEECEDLFLVLVGKRDFFQERLREEIKGSGNSPEPNSRLRQEIGSLPCRDERIIFPAFKDPDGYVPDCDLAVIYKNALLFVFPSLSEGFGLPPLEAMSFGIPVAASNTTCIPEVCGDAVLYFDPKDPEDIARKMKSLINNPALRKDLIQKGFENLKRFSWDKMAEKTLAGYILN